MIPKDGLLEIANCAENGKAVFQTDIRRRKAVCQGNRRRGTLSHLGRKYPVEFVYVTDTSVVEIKANGGEAIENDLIYGILGLED